MNQIWCSKNFSPNMPFKMFKFIFMQSLYVYCHWGYIFNWIHCRWQLLRDTKKVEWNNLRAINLSTENKFDIFFFAGRQEIKEFKWRTSYLIDNKDSFSNRDSWRDLILKLQIGFLSLDFLGPPEQLSDFFLSFMLIERNNFFVH